MQVFRERGHVAYLIHADRLARPVSDSFTDHCRTLDATASRSAEGGAAVNDDDDDYTFDEDEGKINTPVIAPNELVSIDSQGSFGVSDDGKFVGISLNLVITLHGHQFMEGYTKTEHAEIEAAFLEEATRAFWFGIERSRTQLLLKPS